MCGSLPPPTGSSKGCRGGRFREDLYYRFSVITRECQLKTPSRRHPSSRHHFSAAHRCRDRKTCDHLSRGRRVKLFHDYEWSGNVRELENTIEHAVLQLAIMVTPTTCRHVFEHGTRTEERRSRTSSSMACPRWMSSSAATYCRFSQPSRKPDRAAEVLRSTGERSIAWPSDSRST
jgi:transcriptional regulator with GAF, ATPase, and Fis domain